jgi:hypothetical protein
MLEVFEQLASGNDKGGFPRSRIVCHMDWAAEGRSHVDDLLNSNRALTTCGVTTTMRSFACTILRNLEQTQ